MTCSDGTGTQVGKHHGWASDMREGGNSQSGCDDIGEESIGLPMWKTLTTRQAHSTCGGPVPWKVLALAMEARKILVKNA